MQRGIQTALRMLVCSALPSLRVVALVYTGISAIVALMVVVSAEVAPRAPVVQQVTEPAREAVTTLVQPTTAMVTELVAPPQPILVRTLPPPAQPTPAPFVATTVLEVTIDSARPVREVIQEAPVAPRRSPAVSVAPPVATVEAAP